MNGDDDQPPEERTIFNPSTGFQASPTPAEPPPAAAPTPPPPEPVAVSSGEARRIQVGDVLNHIFEVRRFLARGGMGEVFEGVNVSSEERVAIKVILPHLAADPAVQAMFRKEARTLTRLGHPALVQYRVLAQEPVLKVFYIVTEFVEGQNLCDVLRDLNPTPADLVMLTRRLAEGLAAAHALGAIHRDISPDNVMLETGKLDRAKIIDFGIAKDLDASTGTIVGDGFAGKLNYVAPEQLGDFNREVGPWTDVYSLGLVILAVAQGKDVNMGGSLVDAVDKRRAGPDLSPLPAELRPVVERMLRPNPADRARSMEEVIELLANRAALATTPAAAVSASSAKPPKQPKPPREATDAGLPGMLSGKRGMMIGGGAAALVALAAVLAMVFSGEDDAGTAPAEEPGGPVAAAPPADPVAGARALLANGLNSVPCAWLDLADVAASGNGVALSLRGVAGRPAEAQQKVEQLLAGRSIRAASIDLGDVSPISSSECGPIEAFRQIRDPGGHRLTVAQRQFEMIKLADDGGPDAGKIGAQAIISVDTNRLPSDLTLIGMEETGEMAQFVTGKAGLEGLEQVPPGVYRIPLNTTHKGWSGILMLTGRGPFDAALLSGAASSRGADWQQRFLKVAQERGWKSEMVWYRTVDDVPN